ncbi:MAG: hypothetical protein ACE5R4_13380 [Armatimonadota bacterium]
MLCQVAKTGRSWAFRLLSVCLVASATCSALADSPVTSTPFADAYLDYRAVRVARRSGDMTSQIAAYLKAPSTPVDVKAAVVNALSWDIEGKHNAELYCRIMHRCAPEEMDLDALRGDELLVLGYLTLMDDYFHPEAALPILKAAREKLPKSYTVAMICALAEAQGSMSGRKGEAWRPVAKVLDDEGLNGDMRVGAMRIIVGYMKLYQDTE